MIALLTTLLLSVVGPGPQQGPSQSSIPSDELREPANYAAFLAREERLSFGRGAARRARLVLEAKTSEPDERAIALIALGAAGEVADRPLLESRAILGSPEERIYAILALGELGLESTRTLLKLHGAGLAQQFWGPLCLALWRSGSPEARERVSELAKRETGIALLAQGLITGDGLTDHPAVRLLLQLRFDAARRFGFVDGRRWRDIYLAELFDDARFVQSVVLSAARTLRSSALLDHVGNLTFAPGPPGRLAIAVELFPGLLSERADSGSWSPANRREWAVILGAIDLYRLELRTLPLLRLAAQELGLANQAKLLALRAGEPIDDDWIAGILAAAPKVQGLSLIAALGEGHHTSWTDDLWAWVDGSDVDFAAAALVALTVMPDELAKNQLRDSLIAGDQEQRAALLRVMARTVHALEINNLCVRTLTDPRLSTAQRAGLELALAREGRVGGRETLRFFLGPKQPAQVRQVAIRALSAQMGEEELGILRDSFPVEGELSTNVLMAEVFVRHREALGMRLLRHALWHSEWDVSVLAGGLLLQMGGVHVLLEELESPPAGVTESDMRRVGFAIGEFGGPGAVERLEVRRASGDAVLQGAYLGALTNRSR